MRCHERSVYNHGELSHYISRMMVRPIKWRRPWHSVFFYSFPTQTGLASGEKGGGVRMDGMKGRYSVRMVKVGVGSATRNR